jgi:TatD DNase family protein
MDDIEATAAFARSHMGSIALFVGLHPNNPHSNLDAFDVWLVKNASSVDGLGEIGLDERADPDHSRKIFLSQLELASHLNKPVSVHSRGRAREVLDVLSSFDLAVHLHWFQGTEAELMEGMDRGYYISFGPPILYSKRMERLFMRIRLDRLLLETDSPVEYAACFESRASEPFLIASVYFKAASLLGVSLPELEVSIGGNAYRFLGRRIGPPSPMK